jgi:hypothetical protein
MRLSEADNRKQTLLAALRETRGIVSLACARAGVARRTFYNWLDTDADFRRSVEDVNEEAVDFVEGKLLERIEAGAEKSIIFFLKTRGRKRGYRENGSSENQMLTRDMLTAFTSAYSGDASRFDNWMNGPEETISPSDLA